VIAVVLWVDQQVDPFGDFCFNPSTHGPAVAGNWLSTVETSVELRREGCGIVRRKREKVRLIIIETGRSGRRQRVDQTSLVRSNPNGAKATER
jgi:hypothetical protein